jgi:hypothetical protein
MGEVSFCLESAIPHFFYHFLPALSTNLLILVRVFHTITGNFKELLLTIFIIRNFALTPSLSPEGRGGRDGG